MTNDNNNIDSTRTIGDGTLGVAPEQQQDHQNNNKNSKNTIARDGFIYDTEVVEVKDENKNNNNNQQEEQQQKQKDKNAVEKDEDMNNDKKNLLNKAATVPTDYESLQDALKKLKSKQTPHLSVEGLHLRRRVFLYPSRVRALGLYLKIMTNNNVNNNNSNNNNNNKKASTTTTPSATSILPPNLVPTHLAQQFY